MDRKLDEQSQPLTAGIDGSEDDCESLNTDHPRRGRATSAFLPTSIIVLVTAVVFGLLGALLGRKSVNLDSECAAYTTQHSPIIEQVKIKYATTQFNGSFLQESIYRRKGSPEVDAAWEALGVDYRAGVISESEGLASGLSRHHVQRAKKYGGGFLVNVEGMHHLHCLNLVRKALYFNYDRYKAMGHHAFANKEDILRLHVTHCLDTIRQVLMCNVDTGVLGQVWVGPESPIAFPEFNTDHKCKNYDLVRQWAEKLQAPPVEGLPPDYLTMPGAGDILPFTP